MTRQLQNLLCALCGQLCWLSRGPDGSRTSRSADSRQGSRHRQRRLVRRDQGQADRSQADSQGRDRSHIIITNKTKKPINVRLPDAYAGVPVLAQAIPVAVAARAAAATAARARINPWAAAWVAAWAWVAEWAWAAWE